MRVAVMQMSVDPHSRATNLRRACTLIEQAADLDPVPEVVCFPAHCDCGTIVDGGPRTTAAMTDSFIGTLAARTREMGLSLVLGFCEADGRGLYDSAVWCDADGDVLLKHRRMTLTEQEGGVLCAGGEVGAARTMYGAVGLLVGQDLCIPALVSGVAKCGAVAFFAPCRWAAAPPHDELSRTARRHGAWIASANAAGAEPAGGGSCIIDPDGRMVCRAGCDEETIYHDVRLED